MEGKLAQPHTLLTFFFIKTKIGFCWSVHDQQWDKNFEELRRHHAETGGFNVPMKQNRKLATFISRLRTAMSHKEQGLVQQECKL